MVLLDHLSLIRQKESNSSSTTSSDYLFGDAADTFNNTAAGEATTGGDNGQTAAANGGSSPVIAKRKKKNASIEIDAFQLISIDPGKVSASVLTFSICEFICIQYEVLMLWLLLHLTLVCLYKPHMY